MLKAVLWKAVRMWIRGNGEGQQSAAQGVQVLDLKERAKAPRPAAVPIPVALPALKVALNQSR